MFNYHFGHKPSILKNRADQNTSVNQTENLEIPRYNPNSGSVERYAIPKAMPDSFDLPRINKTVRTFGKSEIMNNFYFRHPTISQ